MHPIDQAVGLPQERQHFRGDHRGIGLQTFVQSLSIQIGQLRHPVPMAVQDRRGFPNDFLLQNRLMTRRFRNSPGRNEEKAGQQIQAYSQKQGAPADEATCGW